MVDDICYRDLFARWEEIMNKRMQAIICLGIATLAFSSMELVGKFVADQISPLQLTFLRFMIGFLQLLPLAIIEMRKRQIKLTVQDFGWLTTIGICNITLAMVLLQFAVTKIPASVAAIIISSNPIFVAIFASLILGEKITWRTVLGLGAGIFGLLLVTNIFNTTSNVNLLGLASAVGAALFFGLYTVLSKKVVARLGGLITNVGSFLMGSLALFFILVIKGDLNFQGVNQTTIVPILYLGTVVTGLAYVAFLEGLSRIDASKGAVIFFFKPLVASLLAFLILHETIGSNVWIGTLFIISGSVIIVLQKRMRTRDVIN